MVNNILTTDIIKTYPNIRYLSHIEYLEGDDIFSSPQTMLNEYKRHQVMLEQQNVVFDNQIYPQPNMTQYCIQTQLDTFINSRLDVSNSSFDIIDLSYDLLIEHNVDKIVFKDFYYDISVDHMLDDYSSYSVSYLTNCDCYKINDVLLSYIKRKRKTYKCVCNTLTLGGSSIPFRLDHIPSSTKVSVVEEKSGYTNISYDQYQTFSLPWNGLYYNKEYGWFCKDKNQTALNVLIYDIACNGLNKPLVFKTHKDGILQPQNIGRFVGALYLKLPSIPALIL